MERTSKHKLVKNDGQVFTPDYLVNNILDFAGYNGSVILKKHAIDNSCGAGAFLKDVVKRYCKEAINSGFSKNEIKADLETYIHGIELEDAAFEQVIINLSDTVKEFGLENVKWDVKHSDALTVTEYNGKMDYVLGNPPYVRVHNLTDSYDAVKSFAFANGGMTDLYLVFFELGFRMLNKGGRLCYITPSSWLSSVAGTVMRRYVKNHKNLIGVIDLEHYQPFEATAYTLIALFEEGVSKNTFSYYKYDGGKRDKTFVCELALSQVDIAGNFYLATPQRLDELRAIKTDKTYKYASVKNGFATLADKVFIGDVPECSITIPIIKASTGKWYRGLFPYTKEGQPIPEHTLFSDPVIKAYFESHKEELVKGNPNAKDWIYYGRTQALKDVSKKKFSINTIIKDVESVKLHYIPAGSGVYSGLYILTDVPEDVIKSIVLTQDFVDYIAALKNYKSGGYYTCNSKDIEQYINYKLSAINYEKASSSDSAGQYGIFEGCLELFQ